MVMSIFLPRSFSGSSCSRELLVLDALLNVLVVEVEFVDRVVGAEALVVIVDDLGERFLLLFSMLLVVDPLLRQVFLKLSYVSADISGRREDRCNGERY
jgi:hypothetical protein